eukprot:269514-Prorocentrum_minimum.AAC.3
MFLSFPEKSSYVRKARNLPKTPKRSRLVFRYESSSRSTGSVAVWCRGAPSSSKTRIPRCGPSMANQCHGRPRRHCHRVGELKTRDPVHPSPWCLGGFITVRGGQGRTFSTR